jgi:exosome complex RNA-binding protein Rrp42 (RNase PH superfamily)
MNCYMYAGVEMIAVPVCITVCTSESGAVVVDPNKAEESTASCVAVLATLSTQQGILSSKTVGTLQPDKYLTCVEAATNAAQRMLGFIRLSLEQKVALESSYMVTHHQQ